MNHSESSTFQMAILRTEMANSRTMLAHMQGAIGLMISGIGFMKLFESYLFFDICGWSFLALAVAVLARGTTLYIRTKMEIAEERKALP